MVLIFGASSDTGSSQRSSRIIAPLVRWLCPGLAEAKVDDVVQAVRKTAHFAEYAVLVVLVWYALWKPRLGDQRPWNWPVAGSALLLATLYAASDELHQMYVPTRQGSLRDVLIDTSGAAVGLVVTAMVYRWLARRRGRRLARR
jgi:VanZ family protein